MMIRSSNDSHVYIAIIIEDFQQQVFAKYMRDI